MKSSAGKEFMRSTRYEALEPSDQQKGRPQPPLARSPEPGSEMLKLPDPHTASSIHDSLQRAIEERVSVRTYTGEPLSLEELSYLLWMTQGIKKMIPGRATFRTVPSAGARHALETCLLINTVTSLEPGLYQYYAPEHCLGRIPAPETIAADITAACCNQEFVFQSAVTFLWIAETERMTWRYSERGYRYLHLDAGHVCQNVYLAAESIGCGACAIAAFHDQELNTLLDCDGEARFVIYLAALGRTQ